MTSSMPTPINSWQSQSNKPLQNDYYLPIPQSIPEHHSMKSLHRSPASYPIHFRALPNSQSISPVIPPIFTPPVPPSRSPYSSEFPSTSLPPISIYQYPPPSPLIYQQHQSYPSSGNTYSPNSQFPMSPSLRGGAFRHPQNIGSPRLSSAPYTTRPSPGLCINVAPTYHQSSNTIKEYKNQQLNHSVSNNGTVKQPRRRRRPPFCYSSLIAQAILASPDQRLTLREVYTWIMEKYPQLYKPDDNGWQNTIRHNLSLNKCFKKVPRSEIDAKESSSAASRATRGKGGYWTIDPTYMSTFSDGNFARGTVEKRRSGESNILLPSNNNITNITNRLSNGVHANITSVPSSTASPTSPITPESAT